MNERITNG